MKKVINNTLLVLMLSILGYSCKKNETHTNSITSETGSILQQGEWKITTYIENGNNQTKLFSAYKFLFNIEGCITATNALAYDKGTWSTTGDNAQKPILNFGNMNNFIGLNKEWNVEQQNPLYLKLQHVIKKENAGDNKGIAYLTFEKI